MEADVRAGGYPQIVPGLAFVPVRDGYVVLGSSERKRFVGEVATRLLGQLLPYLDGTRRRETIAELLGAPVSVVDRSIDLLREQGLLRLRSAPAGEPGRSQPMAVFLGRTLPERVAERVGQRLRAAGVAVVGATLVANLIATTLERSGVGVVRRDTAALGPDLTIVTDGGTVPPRVPWLPVAPGPGGITIGPIIGMPGSGCPRCALRRERGPGPEIDEGDIGTIGVAAGVAAGAALRLLGGHDVPSVWRRAIEVSSSGAAPQVWTVGVMPACAACGGPQGRGMPPRCVVRDPSPGGGVAPRSKLYLTQPRIGLRPSGRVHRSLAALLDQVIARRWPATCGAGGTNVYLIDGGAAYYADPARRELVGIRGGRGTGQIGRGPVSVCFTGNLAAASVAHGDAAPHLLDQDAGLAAAELVACGAAIGWDVRVLPCARQGLASLLDLDMEREVPTALIRVVPSAAGELPRRFRRTHAQAYDFAALPLRQRHIPEMLRHQSPHVRCCVFAREVDGGPPGLFLWTAGSGLSRLAGRDECGALETYLLDRGLAPSALLLFGVDLPDLSRDPGAAVMKAAMSARLTQLAAARLRLSSDLLGRLPGSLASAVLGDTCELRFLHGLGVGRPAGRSHPHATLATC